MHRKKRLCLQGALVRPVRASDLRPAHARDTLLGRKRGHDPSCAHSGYPLQGQYATWCTRGADIG